VTVEDAHQANQMVQLWMGTHVGPRKARLMAIWDGEASFDELAEVLATEGVDDVEFTGFADGGDDEEG